MGLLDISLTSSMRSTLFSLTDTSAKIERTQARLASGKKVMSALDNPTNYFAAQAALNRAGDLTTRKDGIMEAIKNGDAANVGLKSLVSLIETAKGIANSAHMAGSSERASLVSQFNEMLSQMDSLAGDSGYRGTNLLKKDDLTVNFNESGSSNLTINGVDASSLGLGVERASLYPTMPIAAENGVGGSAEFLIIEGHVYSSGSVTNNITGVDDIPTAAQSGVTSISAGTGFVLALKNDGSVVAWGYNPSGQTLVPATAQSGVTAIAAGSEFSLALKEDGSVIAWGSNTSGQTSVPIAAQSGVTAIAAGGAFALALKEDGSVIAWGDNTYGQINVPLAAQSGVVAVAAGENFALALKSDGSVVAWGDNTYGQTNPLALPQSGVIAIAAGGIHALALQDNGAVVAWGVDSISNDGVFPPPDAVQSGVTTISVANNIALALKTDGTVIGWGDYFGIYSGDEQGNLGSSGTNPWSTDAGISKSEQQLESALSTLRTDTQTLSSNLSVVAVRKEFTDSMVANLQTGADNLTLADMNEEGANMLMLQTRQNLGITSLSMAGQTAQAVMKLF